LTVGEANAPDRRGIGVRRLSAVEVAAAAPAVRLGSELALKLHETPDLGAVGAEVRLNRGGQLAEGGQVDAEQLRASLQRRRDRPAQVWVVPGPHQHRVSNTSSRSNREYCLLLEQPLSPCLGRAGAADGRNLGDSNGQQGTINHEVSGRFGAMYLGCETAGVRFHMARAALPWFR
jgi:hypothetical protein